MKNLMLIQVFLFFLLQDLAAQNINGFQIFVSKKQFTSIEFHSAIDNLAFAQRNPPYKVVFMGAKTIFLETSQEVKAPYDLSIIEGGRKQKLVIVYADAVNPSKRDNDYSSLAELKTLIKSFVPVAVNSSTQADSKKSASHGSFDKGSDQMDPGPRSSTSPSNLNFYVLIDEADKARKAGQWQIAKNKYKQALQIQPDNSYAQAHLQSVNATIQSESETKKRGDSLAASQLRQLNQQMQEDSVAAVRSRLDSAFTRLINAANEAVDKKDFNTAVFSYTEALKLKPGDEFAISQVSKVQQAIIQAQGDSVKQQEVAMSNNEKGIDSIKADVDSGTVDIAASAANEIEKGMLLIKARYFKMGSDVGSTDESPMHSVKLDSFYISRFEVTQSQWQSIMGDNPSFFKNCDECPVEHVSWYDATKFIERLNQISHKNYRLPTEAEWEYVAGTQNRKDDIDDIAWYNDNAGNKTHHIGLLQPDFLGVYDMFGNVAEWCSDWYSYSSYRKNLAVNPNGSANGREKVIRGGSWYDMGGSFRSSVRDKISPDKANKKIGFRLAMSLN